MNTGTNRETPEGSGSRSEFESTSPKSYGETWASTEHPKRNEDAIFVTERLAGVFDGVGSCEGSENASKVAANYCQDALEKLPEALDPEEAQCALEQILRDASDAICEYADKQEIDDVIATTAVIAGKFTDPETGVVYMAEAHTGDSRACLIASDGRIKTTTLDHSVVDASEKDLHLALDLQDELATIESKPEENSRIARFFSRRNYITSFLGNSADYYPSNRIPVRTSAHELEPGEIVLLTSDGVHDNLTAAEIEQCCRIGANNPKTVVALLLHIARERSTQKGHIRAKPDDMSAAVLAA